MVTGADLAPSPGGPRWPEGEAPEGRKLRTVSEGRSLALTRNLGGGPGECVSFVSVVGTEREV
jgi:hypothetical protein